MFNADARHGMLAEVCIKLGVPTREQLVKMRAQVEAEELKRLDVESLPPWAHLPRDLQKLLEGMMCYDPTMRLTAQQVAEHPYFKRIANELDDIEVLPGQASPSARKIFDF